MVLVDFDDVERSSRNESASVSRSGARPCFGALPILSRDNVIVVSIQEVVHELAYRLIAKLLGAQRPLMVMNSVIMAKLDELLVRGLHSKAGLISRLTFRIGEQVCAEFLSYVGMGT